MMIKAESQQTNINKVLIKPNWHKQLAFLFFPTNKKHQLIKAQGEQGWSSEILERTPER